MAPGMIGSDKTARPRKGLEHKTIAAAVASELRRRIVSGSFAGGVQLRQDMLAREFDVSRVPVREALVQLESEGLVKIHAHRGAVVSAPSLDEIREVFELRELLEPRLLLESAPKLTAEDFEELQEIAARYVESRAAGDVASCAELNTEFHLGLYRHTGRSRTLSIVAGLLRDSERHTRLQLNYDENKDTAIADDARILALCSTQRYPEASEVMRLHIRAAAASFAESMALMNRDGPAVEAAKVA